MHLRTLSNDELLRIAHNEIDDLTSTPLEVELLRRLEALVDAHGQTVAKVAEHDFADSDAAAVLEQIASFELDADDIQKLGAALIVNSEVSTELLQALAAAGIDNADALTARLQLADGFTALASDANDLFSRLSTLAEATQE